MIKDILSKEQFIEYIDKIKEKNKLILDIHEASKGLVDLVELEDKILQPYYFLETCIFNDREIDYIYWFLYEYDEKHMKVYNGDEVVADIKTVEDLWEFLNRE